MNPDSPAPELLPDRAIIALSGEGVLAFLHNILTCDVEGLEKGEAAYGALLSPQGKILHDMFIYHAGEHILLDCAADQRDAFIQKLKLYRLRAKFEIAVEDALEIGAGPAAKNAYADPRLPLVGHRHIVPKGQLKAGAAYTQKRLSLGLADSTEIGSNLHFPHEANFDLLNGVNFKKGCYVGQEVVSRMQHRGTARSRILPVTIEGDASAKEIRSGDMQVGTLLSQHTAQGMALIRLDRLEEAQLPLFAGDAKITVHKPDWFRP